MSQPATNGPAAAALTDIDWLPFLGRPLLPAPAPEVLSRLRATPLMVTGAAGSIGKPLSLHLARLAPKQLVLLDNSEQGLFELSQLLTAEGLAENARLVLGSVADLPLLDELLATHQPRIIFHAAAYKHLPLLEDHPLAALANNALATRTLCKAVAAIPARVVLLSTDKAADPISILGASKSIAEQVVAAAGGIVLRLANVLGSRGSVVESFQQQLANGQPLRITHLEADRYFLTCNEAVNLLLSAAILAEPATILAPKLDSAHRIADLASFLAQRDGTRTAARIHDSGLRPGEKLHETLWSASEHPSPSPVPGTFLLNSQPEPPIALDDLQSAVEARNLPAALSATRSLVPGYQPASPSPEVAPA